MKPHENTRVWRKEARKAGRGVKTGRRTTHRQRDDAPRTGSTWVRRHGWLYGWDTVTVYYQKLGRRS